MANKLNAGEVRFMVGFDDAELTVPIVRTIQFACLKESERGESMLIFEEISLKKRERIFVYESDFDDLVLNNEQLLDVLRKAFDGTLARRFD